MKNSSICFVRKFVLTFDTSFASKGSTSLREPTEKELELIHEFIQALETGLQNLKNAQNLIDPTWSWNPEKLIFAIDNGKTIFEYDGVLESFKILAQYEPIQTTIWIVKELPWSAYAPCGTIVTKELFIETTKELILSGLEETDPSFEDWTYYIDDLTLIGIFERMLREAP